MKKLTKNQKIALGVIVAVLVIGGIVYFSQRNSGSNSNEQTQENSNSGENGSSNTGSNSSGSNGGTGSNGSGGTNGNTGGSVGKGYMYEVKELAIKFMVPAELADLRYVISATEPKTAHFSSASLRTTGGDLCSASNSPLGSISWNSNIPAESKRVPDKERFKQFGSEWVSYTLPDSTCAKNMNKAAQDLQQKQAEAFGKAFQGLTVTSRVASTWAPNSTLVNKEWKWVRTQKTNNIVSAPTKPDTFSLTFKSDGNVTGTTDCNSFGAKYVTSGEKMTFSQMVQTLKFCSGSQETLFTGSINNVESYYFDSTGRLVLKLKQDAGFMVFK